MEKIATKTTWQNHPIDNPKRIKISLHFTERQFSKFVKGFIPQDMDDKWFVYFENDWLYFHRSGTGFGIYKAQLNKKSDSNGYSINEFWVERNQKKYINQDHEDVKMFSLLITRGLLEGF